MTLEQFERAQAALEASGDRCYVTQLDYEAYDEDRDCRTCGLPPSCHDY